MKKLPILLLALLLPMISLAQSAEECYLKANRFYNNKEYDQAFSWGQKAADQGHAEAQCFLGHLYESGYGVKKDYVKAFECYQIAADQGFVPAQYIVGGKYMQGLGVKVNYDKGVEWLQKAAENGYDQAQFSLGILYERGFGVGKDITKAIDWYQKAANQGNEDAKKNLASLQKKNVGGKNAVEQSSVSQTESADECYKKGKEYFDKKDYKHAIKWYQKAANQGHAIAQVNLGTMYINGYGIERDYSKAIEWYQKAADQGYATAQHNLGSIYRIGYGVEKDYAKAFEWYHKAANQGLADAQNALGFMYANGLGIEKDYEKAVEWYQKAANQEHALAKENLAELQKKIAENNNDQELTINNSQSKESIDLVDSNIPVVNRLNGNTFAIIIANEDYQDETKVDYAKNDGEVFKNYCHKTLGIPEKNVHLVVNATRNNIIGELYWLSQVCKAYKGDASVIFYYAGHGLPDEDSGSAYLLPVDGKSELLPTCYSVNELYKTLGSLPTKRVTVLMDACFSGAKRNGGMLTSARGVAIKAKLSAPKGRMIVLSAAQGNETAYKYDDAKHGLFTYFLLKKLKDSKGGVTMGELSNYIQDQVGRYSIVENGKSQTPTIQISDALRSNWRNLRFD